MFVVVKVTSAALMRLFACCLVLDGRHSCKQCSPLVAHPVNSTLVSPATPLGLKAAHVWLCVLVLVSALCRMTLASFAGLAPPDGTY